MHALLLRPDSQLKRADLFRNAHRLGLDLQRFAKALNAQRFQARIADDVKQARSLRLSVTPTYFMNGKKIVGVSSFSTLRRRVERELASRARLSSLSETEGPTAFGTL